MFDPSVFPAPESVHDRFQNFVDPSPHFRARVDRFFGRDREDLFQLSMHGSDVGVRKSILLITARWSGLVCARDARSHRCASRPARIDNQKRAFARGQRSRKLHSKIDMPRRVEKVQAVHFARLRRDMSSSPDAL